MKHHHKQSHETQKNRSRLLKLNSIVTSNCGYFPVNWALYVCSSEAFKVKQIKQRVAMRLNNFMLAVERR